MNLRILALDHFFDQDLAALRAALEPGESLTIVPYQRLYRIAKRVFPQEAFTGVAAAMDSRYAQAWRRYLPKVNRIADWWIAAYRPTVLVLPSDAIFYVRPLIERFGVHGIPTAVVQKETTISPMVMDDHARAVATSVPFMSDVMTVCSERQRDFWVRAGSDPARIRVTGQPRFDVYSHPSRGGTGAATRTLLYFSYEDVAYLPSDTGQPYEGTWRDLRRETEQELAAATPRWRVVAKRHPQQTASESWLGASVEHPSQGADTRQLVLEADVVVGFQTTALFEAMAAGRPVIYAAWGPVYEQAKPMLIPFESYEGAVLCATSRTKLRELLSQDPEDLVVDRERARAVVQEEIGVVDGQAARRALVAVREVAAAAGDDKVVVRAPSRLLIRGLAIGAAGRLLKAMSPTVRRSGQIRFADAMERRASHWEQERQEVQLTRRVAG